MKCDNCGQETSHCKKEEFTVTKFQLGWPPVYREIRHEWWCRRCYMADHPGSSAASARKRRKLDFEEDERP